MDIDSLASKIKLLLMDVDGVLTDGRIYNLPDPEGKMVETKGFDSQDGIALHWPSWKGIQTGVISGRDSPVTEERARQCGGDLRFISEATISQSSKTQPSPPLFSVCLLPSDEYGRVQNPCLQLKFPHSVVELAARSIERFQARKKSSGSIPACFKIAEAFPQADLSLPFSNKSFAWN